MIARIRRYLFAACAVASLVGLLVVASGHAQPPGFSGGGQFPRPGMPGGAGVSGMPGGGISGIPGGGISGMPGGTGISGLPTGPGMPGGGGLGGFEHVYTCSGCGKELGRGMFKPNLEKCPFCGVRFGNTVAGRMADMQDRMGGMGGWNNGAPGAASAPNGPGANAPFGPGAAIPPNFPEAPMQPTPPIQTPPTPAPVFTPTIPTTTPTSSSSTGRSMSIALIWVLVGVVSLLVFVALIGGVIWLISTAPSLGASPPPRRRPRRRNVIIP